ncbi:carboxymuconolactone decarboxylase family protein [Psychroserpens mesophilus]|uniref:carboxymuconolactone decarboxylase family protein n=1 Tax=Psychroserpens mesophilus TaxID=325473 RepID=UPI003F491102
MTSLKINTLETAPEGSKQLIETSIKNFGRLPGLHGVLASSPQTFEAYQKLHELFSNSSFNAEELTVVWQTINVENECHYCVPAHTGIAHMMKVDPAITEALRNQEALPNEKLQALHDMTLKIVRNRGHVSQEDLNTFYEAGYGEQQVLEIILGLAQKTISNYTNHIANTPVDAAFEKFAWEPVKL